MLTLTRDQDDLAAVVELDHVNTVFVVTIIGSFSVVTDVRPRDLNFVVSIPEGVCRFFGHEDSIGCRPPDGPT